MLFQLPFRCFKFLRMPFGIVSASEVFQKKMIEAFEGIECVEVIYDNVLVTERIIKENDH